MMNMMSYAINFLDPSAWWGLLGLLIPLLIHLLSKKEKHVIPFGSLQFLQTVESDSAKSIQLSQYLLLFLRLLLIGLICTLLVQPFIKEDKKKITYWIDANIYRSSDYGPILDKLPEEENIHIHSHELSDSIGVEYYKSSWTLIDYLNQQPDSSIVYSHSLQKDFIGQPVSIGSKVNWTIIPQKDKPVENKLLNTGKGSIEWSVIANKNKLAVNTKAIAGNAERKTLKLKLIENGYDREAAKIKEIIALSEAYLYYDIDWVSESEDLSIVVGSDQNRFDQNAISWIPSDQLLDIQSDNATGLQIVGKVDRESIIDSNLPVRIAALFNNYMTGISDHDARVLDPSQFVNETNSKEHSQLNTKALAKVDNQRSLHRYLLALIALIFITERFVSFKNSENA